MGTGSTADTPASLSIGAGIAIGIVLGTIFIGLMVGGWAFHRNRRRRAEEDANTLPLHNRPVHNVDAYRLSGDTIAVPPHVHQRSDARAHRNVPLPHMVIELDDFDHHGRRLARPVQRSDLADFRPATGIYEFASLEDQHRSHLERRGHVVSIREPGVRRPTTPPIRPPPVLPSRPRPAVHFVTEDGRDAAGNHPDDRVIVVPDHIANRTVPRRPRPRPRRPVTPEDGYIIPPVLRGLVPEMMRLPPEMFGLGPEMVGLGNPFDQEGLPRHWSNESVDTLPRYDSPPPKYEVLFPTRAEGDTKSERG